MKRFRKLIIVIFTLLVFLQVQGRTNFLEYRSNQHYQVLAAQQPKDPHPSPPPPRPPGGPHPSHS
ncbi:hypothetical protein ACP275_07G075500 [Erythranthe tilingii]